MLHKRHRLPRELDGAYTATFERLRRFFLSRGVPAEEAADLAQEAIARCLGHVLRNGAHDRPEGVTPLLNRIAQNLLIDRARAKTPYLISIDSVDQIDDASDPSEEVVSLDARRAVRTAIGALPARHRRALMMSLEGKTPAEIARDFGIQRNAADALLYRARRGLAAHLRVGADVALGLVAIMALRLRAGARRAAELGRLVEAAAMSPLAVNLATAALATAFVLSAPTPTAHAIATQDAAGPTMLQSRTVDVAPSPAVDVAGETIEEPMRAGTRATFEDPVTGSENEARLLIFYEPPEEGEPDLVSRVVAFAIEEACGTAPFACEGDE